MADRRQALLKLVGDLYGSFPYTDDELSEYDLRHLTDTQLVQLCYRLSDVLEIISDDFLGIDWRTYEKVFGHKPRSTSSS